MFLNRRRWLLAVLALVVSACLSIAFSLLFIQTATCLLSASWTFFILPCCLPCIDCDFSLAIIYIVNYTHTHTRSRPPFPTPFVHSSVLSQYIIIPYLTSAPSPLKHLFPSSLLLSVPKYQILDDRLPLPFSTGSLACLPYFLLVFCFFVFFYRS